MTDALTTTPDNTPDDAIALVFPGQGSQSPGMGKLLHANSEAARRTFEEAMDLTGIDLASICFDSDADDLASTENTQPAVLTTSVAFLRAMREKLNDAGGSVRPRLFGGTRSACSARPSRRTRSRSGTRC